MRNRITSLAFIAGSAIAFTSPAQSQEADISTPSNMHSQVSVDSKESESTNKKDSWIRELQPKAGILNKDCDLFNAPRSLACVGTTPGVQRGGVEAGR